MPTRDSTKASGIVSSTAGLTYAVESVAPAKPAETLALTVRTVPQTVQSSSSSAPETLQAAGPLDRNDPNLRITAASATTPQAPNNAPAQTTPTATATVTPPRTATTTAPVLSQVTPAGIAPQPTATPKPSAACDTSVSALYCVYTVDTGDTLSGIASKMGVKGNDDVAAWELLVASNRPDIVSEDDLLQIGQKLRIPVGGVALAATATTTPVAAAAAATTPKAATTPQAAATAATGGSFISATLHTVLNDQTLIEIAEQYDVTSAEIIGFNKLADANALAIGQELLIPNPKRFAKPAPPAPAVTAAPTLNTASAPSSGSTSSGSAAAGAPSGARSSAGFIWPVGGPISSYFGPSHPLGIDVDLFKTPNAPIAAVKSGTVKFAGGNACCSYGLYVIVEHSDGIQTLYAHLSKISVSAGQSVSQGSTLGLGGRTGYSTGNHLHFEVHVNGTVVNPMGYLP